MSREIAVESPSGSTAARRQPLLPAEKDAGNGRRRRSRVGETAGECAAVCCCCPCAAAHLLILAVYRLPRGIWRKKKRRRNSPEEKENQRRIDSSGLPGGGYGKEEEEEEDDDEEEKDGKGSNDAVDWDNEVWGRFGDATGFSPKYPVPNHTIRRRSCCRLPAVLAALKASPPPVNEFAGDDDVLRAFLKEREMNGDFVSRLCDELWLRGVSSNLKNNENSEEGFGSVKLNDLKILEEENEGGFLKLKRTSEWLSGEDETAPMNKKITSKEVRDESLKRKRLNFLRYEALKRELLFVTVGIGIACSGYCLVTFSVQVNYMSICMYFQLLCNYTDSLSREAVPEIFTKKKSKKIGIRSEDLQDSFEKTLKGSSIALSSPRLVFPAAIYGIWELSQHFAHDIFDFQLVPAMMGLFAYKAAALVQVYRDNEDLQFIFPENADGSSD
ncbi:Unknown protein [Striga hermonthica]|uniref:Uncharacterized protein n=1 Tax=Striga hermonthica TaxID=68872 RepID=A0A9N7RPD5_STRHE|nr:Unknown protein [Striga hermonthica]